MHRTRLLRRMPAGPLFSDIGEVCAPELPRELVVHIPTAKVVIANYRAILHDFPHVFGRDFREKYTSYWCESCNQEEGPCLDAIDQWVVDHAAYVSLRQAEVTTVNSKIHHDRPVELAYRPPRYGRALVVPVDGPRVPGTAGLLDIKGAGVAPDRTPSHSEYSNGLEYLGVAIADFFYGWLIDWIFARTEQPYWTVPVYALLDLGFDIKDGWHGTAPAGLHVRRAHARGAGGLPIVMSRSDDEVVCLHIELLLRSYGLTSANRSSSFEIAEGPNGGALHFGGKAIKYIDDRERQRGEDIVEIVGDVRLEMLNIQLTRDTSWDPRMGQMFDFGHISARRRFRFPLASAAQDRLLQVGHIIRQHEPAFVQPDPALRVDPDLCDRHSVNALGFYLAQAFRNGRLGRTEVEYAIRRAIVRALGRK